MTRRRGHTALPLMAIALVPALSACGVSEPARVRPQGHSVPSPSAARSSSAVPASSHTSLAPAATGTSDRSASLGHTPPMPAESVLSVEPWTFEDAPGVLVSFHHRLRTTRTDEFTLRTLPTLLDYAVERYRRPLGDHSDLRLPPSIRLGRWRSICFANARGVRSRGRFPVRRPDRTRINRGGYAGRACGAHGPVASSSPGTDGMTGEPTRTATHYRPRTRVGTNTPSGRSASRSRSGWRRASRRSWRA